jgi:predicted RNase H-like nuclease (RuvC/YqgF family)
MSTEEPTEAQDAAAKAREIKKTQARIERNEQKISALEAEQEELFAKLEELGRSGS